MGAAKPLLTEITHYLKLLSPEQQKLVLGVVKNFAHEEKVWRTDKEYLAEMDRRFAEMERGKAKVLTLDQLEEGAKKAYRRMKQAGK